MRRRGQEVTVAGPDLEFSCFDRRSQLNGIAGAKEDAGRQGPQLRADSPKQGFAGGDERPNAAFG
jgi:hypothetical protein